jgi:hypothetical protein
MVERTEAVWEGWQRTSHRKFLRFRSGKCLFVKRDGNKIAHVLAKYAVQRAVETMWVSPPDCNRELLLLEHFALAA